MNLTKAFLFIFLLTSSLVKAKRISVMTFNVENLFDTSDDPGKDDQAFLPLSSKTNMKHLKKCDPLRNLKWKFECLYLDWTKNHLNRKMKNLAKIARAANPALPDILILQEVENITVLKSWVNKHLGGAYKTVELIEGRDKRGIDVAVLSKFSIAKKSILHQIPFQEMKKKTKKDTRGILEVTLKGPKNEKISVYAVHFPAPFHPRKFRRQSLAFLNKLVKRSNADLKIAAGDMNIPSTEERKFGVLKSSLKNIWKAAHLEACKNCDGTYYYAPKKEWSFLDVMLYSANGTWKLANKTAKVVHHPVHVSNKNRPKGFDFHTGDGASDHFPFYAEFKKAK